MSIESRSFIPNLDSLKPLNEVVQACRTLQSSATCSQANDEEVIRLASDDESQNKLTPPSNRVPLLLKNREFLDESISNFNQDFSISFNDSTQIMNGVLDNEVFDEDLEDKLPFINQPRFEYHSKSDAHFENYLDWIMSKSFSDSF